MIRRFEVYWANLDPTIGKEIKKTRPCAVISPDELNDNLDTVIVVPLTSTIKNWPFRKSTKVTGTESAMAFDQIRTISKLRLTKRIGTLTKSEQEQALLVLQTMFAR